MTRLFTTLTMSQGQVREIDDAKLYQTDRYAFEEDEGPIDRVEVERQWYESLPEDPEP